MLTKCVNWSLCPLFIMVAFVQTFGSLILCPSARAEEAKKSPVILMLDASDKRDSYSYRKMYHDKSISIMLFGFRDQPVRDRPASILKDRKALSAFFDHHFNRIKDDYFSKDPNKMRLVAGERAFNSTELNRGPGIEPAKMAGMTVPFGKVTVGGGYTWSEKNPAMLRLTKAEGFFVGGAYDTGKLGVQLSYLTSGQEVMGFEIGGTDIRYDSLMLGTSFRVNKRMGLTATLQYRKDEDPLTTGEKNVIFTVGTRWKF